MPIRALYSLYPRPPTTVPLFSTSRQHNIHNRNPKLSVIHVLRFQECFWLFSIYEYFSKIAMHVDYQTITGHDIIRKNTKHRNDREDTLTMDLWNAFIEAIDKKSSIALRQVKDDIDHIHDEYLTCVRFCIGSLIKPPNHVCVSNTEILSSIARIVSCTWC